MTFGDWLKRGQQNDTIQDDVGIAPPEPQPDYPPAVETLARIRALLDPMSGVVRVNRKLVGWSEPPWSAEADINAKGRGPDFKLEISGNSLDEVASALLDVIEQVIGQ